MSRILAACAVLLLSLLALAAPASAEQGLWDGTKGVQHLHFQTDTILVKPGQNSINNVLVKPSQKPKVDGYIVRARPDLTYVDGTVPPVDVIHLHHGVWLNASATSPASPAGAIQPIFFGGEEKTVFRIPKGYGYAYKKSDVWILNEMIHNNTPNTTKVRLVWDLDFIPKSAPVAKSVTPVIPFWMDVRRGWGYPVFDVAQRSGGSDGQFTFPDDEVVDPYAGGPRQNEFSMPYDGTAVAAVGHLHPGGLRDDIDITREGAGTKRVFTSKAKYLRPGRPRLLGRLADRVQAEVARRAEGGRHALHPLHLRLPAVLVVREHGHRLALRRAQRGQGPGPVRHAGRPDGRADARPPGRE